MKNKILFVISSILVLLSCTKEIKYNGGVESSFMVVNCVTESDSSIQVSLSRSVQAIGEISTGSNDITTLATLTLTDNTTGATYTANAVNSSNLYDFGTTAKVGHSYSLSVYHPDYGTSTASTSIPQPEPIIAWDTTSTESGGNGFNKGKRKTVDLSWNDPDGENFYIVKVVSIDTILNTETVKSIRTSDGSELSGDKGNEALFFNDNLFNNGTKQLSISFREDYMYDQMSGLQVSETYYRIELYNTSKEAFNYLLSVTKSISSNNNPFSEPVKVYTNVTNGLGIFGGLNRSFVVIK